MELGTGMVDIFEEYFANKQESEKPREGLYVPDESELFYRERTIQETINLIMSHDTPRNASSNDRGRNGFNSEPDFMTAFDKLQHGDPAMFDLVQAAMDTIDPALTKAPRREFFSQRDVSGAEVLVSDFLSHEPECMIEHYPKLTSKEKFLDISVNCSMSWAVEPKQYIAASAKVFAHIKALEISGRRCRLSMVESCSRGSSVMQNKVVVKEFSELTNWSVVSWCFCSPDFLRRILFRLEELESDKIRQQFGFHSNCGGYGKPTKYQATSEKEVIFNLKDYL
jgi:hypothetical protein